ncbi:MAG: hypothetical protein L0191_03165 [Acidobacteria bacterium]|nr:hypothetical protein [Acidobacteriota bacterium]
MAERDSTFVAALEDFFAEVDEGGEWDVAAQVATLMHRMGRALTPEEVGVARQRVWEAILLDAITLEHEEIPGDAPEGETPGEGEETEVLDKDAERTQGAGKMPLAKKTPSEG